MIIRDHYLKPLYNGNGNNIANELFCLLEETQVSDRVHLCYSSGPASKPQLCAVLDCVPDKTHQTLESSIFRRDYYISSLLDRS